MLLIAELFSPPVTFSLGLIILCAVLLRHLALGRSRRSQRRDLAAEARNEAGEREKAPAQELRRMEVRLHDYSREVESRVLSTMEILDQLVLDADREIAHLEDLLNDAGKSLARPQMRPGPDIVRHTAEVESAGGLPGNSDDTCCEYEPYPGYNGGGAAVRVPSPDERRMMRHLYQAGFSVADITKTFRCSADVVKAALQDVQRGDSEAA